MSEIKPVYQSQTNGVWHDVTKEDFDARSYCPDLFNLRILYPAAAYEALQKENENLAHRLNNAQDSAIKALEKNAAQAKRIAELEAGVVDIRDWTARWTRPDHPIVTVANRLLAATKNGE